MAKQRHGITDFLAVFNDVAATFFDLETDLLVTLDEQGDISRVNQPFQKALGYNEAQIFGLGFIRLVNVDDWAKFVRAFSTPEPLPFRLLCSVSGEIPVRLVAARFRNGRAYLVLRKVEP